MNEGTNTSGRDDSQGDLVDFTWLDVGLTLFGIFGIIFDVGSDINLVITSYWNEDDPSSAVLTLGFVIAPSVVVLVYNFCLRDCTIGTYKEPGPKIMDPVVGSLRCTFRKLRMGLKFKRQKNEHRCTISWEDVQNAGSDHHCVKTYRKVLAAEGEVTAGLKLFEAAFEAGPQVTVQMYIFFKYLQNNGEVNRNVYLQQGISIAKSLLSFAWAPVAAERVSQLTVKRKPKMEWGPTAMLYLNQVFFLAETARQTVAEITSHEPGQDEVKEGVHQESNSDVASEEFGTGHGPGPVEVDEVQPDVARANDITSTADGRHSLDFANVSEIDPMANIITSSAK